MTSFAELPLHGMCARALASDPDRRAIELEGRWTCWGDMRAVAVRMEDLLEQGGVPSGAPVVFIPRNRPSSIAALLGLLGARRTVRMVYAFQSPAAVARELEALDPLAVVADAEDFSDEVWATLRTRGAAGVALSEGGVTCVEGMERARTATHVDFDAPPQIEILTSGTTGAPKRFGLEHTMVAKHIVGANKNFGPEGADDRQPPAFLYYPLGNISGIYTILPTLLRGHRVSLAERFSVDAWREHILRHRPERASLPPAGFRMVLDAAVPPEDLAGVRCIATGAAPLSPGIQREFEERYGLPVLLSYGATEFGGPVTSMTLELRQAFGDEKRTSVGRPIGGARLRVVSRATGECVPPGEEGLLEVVSPRVGPDWIRTSDLAVIDADGFVFHRGRADGAIMRGGFKLLPETIERALLLHPAVRDAAVVALPDARLGQVPVAAIELRSSANAPAVAELERHVRDHVYATHVPSAWRIVDALPRNASFKVDRAATRRLFEPTPVTAPAPLAVPTPS